MARCAICDKGPAFGNNVSHANNKTRRVWRPNLRRVHVTTPEGNRRIMVCTRCLSAGKIVKA
jgi:large subunit ribosomal protein L28